MQAAANSEYLVSLPHVFSPCVDGVTEAAALGLHACWGVADRAIGGFPPPGLVVMVASMLQRSSGMTCALRVRAVDEGTTRRRPPDDGVHHNWRIVRESPDACSATIYTRPAGVVHDDDPTATALAENEEGVVRLPLVFGPDATDDEVFRRVGAAAVHEALFKGRSRAFVAYGVMGSGKSSTISGLILRSLAYVFEQRDSHRSLGGVRVKLAFTAIDSRRVFDLLDASATSDASARTTSLAVRAGTIEGLQWCDAESVVQVVADVFVRGGARRQQLAAQLGRSAESAATVFIVTIHTAAAAAEVESPEVPRLVFVVLPASERRPPRTGIVRGPTQINLSRVFLGCCEQRRPQSGGHFPRVPYGESMLTRVLKPELEAQRVTLFFSLAQEPLSSATYRDNRLTLRAAHYYARAFEERRRAQPPPPPRAPGGEEEVAAAGGESSPA